MQVDIEDVLFWMDAIRNSDDRYRTLESFWKGQVHSKIWLIENLSKYVLDKPNRVVIYGGWNGVLASLLFNSNIPIEHITSIDIDSDCEEIANTINKRYEIEGRFSTLTQDMCDSSIAGDIIINTVCEHITQNQYNQWLQNLQRDSLIVLQGNNYDIPEHIRVSGSLKEFENQCQSIDALWSGALDLPLYTRFMVIGSSIL